MGKLALKKCKHCFNRALDDKSRSFCIIKNERVFKGEDICEDFRKETHSSLNILVSGRM